MSIISADNHLLVFTALALLMWFGLVMEKTRIGKITTGLVWTGGIAIILSNVGVLPKSAAVYDFVKGYLVPLAIPLFLFSVNLREIFRNTGKTMIAFIIGAMATVIGTIISATFIELGSQGSNIAGVFTATYIGGSLNFAASAEALNMKDDVLLSAALAADSLVGKSYLMLLATLPAFTFVTRFFQKSSGSDKLETPAQEKTSAQSINLINLATAFALALAICALGYWLADTLGMASFGILFITALALIPGSFFPDKTAKIHGSYELGIICAFLFFAAVGAGADVGVLLTVAPGIIIFAFLVVLFHALILFPIARLMGLSLAETVTASNACILGPTTAAALAAVKGWHSQVTPGLLTGIFGYGIGTFLGVLVAKLI